MSKKTLFALTLLSLLANCASNSGRGRNAGVLYEGPVTQRTLEGEAPVMRSG